MTEQKQLDAFYKQNLEQDIITHLAILREIPLRKAMDIYYSSKLSIQIAKGEYGIENLSPQYLAEDLCENEPNLF